MTVEKMSLSRISMMRRCTFLKFADKQILFLQECGRLGTARNYLCAKNSLETYIQGKELPFSALTGELLEEYELWLKKRKVSRNTISFYMRTLRSIYNKAVECRIVKQRYPFGKVYTGVDRTRKRAIDEEMIARLSSMRLSAHPSLSYARDLFIFSFYTRGMSFVDMAYLRKEDIRGEILYYVRHKTGQLMSVHIEPCMLKIMNRYMRKSKSSPYIFPVIRTKNEELAYCQYRNALSYYNKQLKKISRLLELPVSLTSYVSRHTWATTARKKNIPLSVISAGMGHSSETTTQIYLASLDTSVVDEANRFIIDGL